MSTTANNKRKADDIDMEAMVDGDMAISDELMKSEYEKYNAESDYWSATAIYWDIMPLFKSVLSGNVNDDDFGKFSRARMRLIMQATGSMKKAKASGRVSYGDCDEAVRVRLPWLRRCVC